MTVFLQAIFLALAILGTAGLIYAFGAIQRDQRRRARWADRSEQTRARMRSAPS